MILQEDVWIIKGVTFFYQDKPLFSIQDFCPRLISIVIINLNKNVYIFYRQLRDTLIVGVFNAREHKHNALSDFTETSMLALGVFSNGGDFSRIVNNYIPIIYQAITTTSRA